MFGNITIQARVSCTFQHHVQCGGLNGCAAIVQCEVCSVGSGLQQRITRTTITKCVPQVHQPTHIRAWLACSRVVGATITGALWGCLVSLQVGQESSSVYAMCPPSSSRSPNTTFFPSVNLFDPTIGNGNPPEIPSPEKFGEGLLCP